ncbi:DUF4168 domain-containing protein [Pelagerythrobacter marensis]|uniref:DUF4168 domain-containing protein n=1 Tax=Pelagerythrobacter marensis TaxID=543877 RepID=A0ABZ2D3I3_9SPHN
MTGKTGRQAWRIADKARHPPRRIPDERLYSRVGRPGNTKRNRAGLRARAAPAPARPVSLAVIKPKPRAYVAASNMEDCMKTVFALAAASLVVSGGAFAQEAAAPQTAQAAPQSADISDEQVDRFALAALKVEQIAGDTTMDQQEKQAKMMAAVEESGMAPQEFNAIAVASQGDPQLQERIQAAASAHVEAAQPAGPSGSR